MARLLACTALAATLGCTYVSGVLQGVPMMRSGQITEEELHNELLTAANRFIVGVATAADAIAQQSTDRNVRRRALLWKVRMIPLAQQGALETRATQGLLQLFALTTAQREYLVTGAGSTLFGDQQETARATAIDLERGLEELCRRVLSAAQADRLNTEVEKLASANPIRGEFRLESTQGAFSQAASRGSFDFLLRAPLVPFRALEGVESGAQAMHEINTTARQFSDLIAVLPEQTRWQMELFLYDLEDRQTVIAALESTQSIAESAERLSIAAETLPAAARRELVALLEESGAGQAELRETLAALRETLASADSALGNARPLAESLERIAANVDAAGKSWQGVVESVRARDNAPPDPNAKPFDILDYERTATRIGTAASELRALVADVQGGGPGGSLLDALLWRAFALVAASFALLLVYRVLAGLLPRR